MKIRVRLESGQLFNLNRIHNTCMVNFHEQSKSKKKLATRMI